MKAFRVIFVLLFVMSCAPVKVYYDYERTTSFSKYKTYNFYDASQSGLSALDVKRLFAALETKLETKGFEISETPDFYIEVTSAEYQNTNRRNVGVGIGGTGGNVGGGVSVGIPLGQTAMSRVITFNFVDEEGVGLFWQAVSESSYNVKATPERREAQFKAIVEKVLEGYPPK